MTARDVLARLLAALADATPAFRADAHADASRSGRGRRLLAALADAAPAFGRAAGTDEYASPPEARPAAGPYARVLLVEPDARTAGELGRALARHGIPDVRGASPDELFDRLDGVEVVVLDLGAAPRSESVRLCLRIRAVSDAGVILTSAGGDARDRVQALQAGADDYLVKPYGVDELADRITAVGLRRRWKVAARGEPGDVVRFGDVEVDLNRHVVSSGGRPVPLTRREFRVLAVLAEAGGEVRTRERLLTEVWGASGAAESRSLDAHIAALRRKLGDPSVIEAVGEAGYRLVAPPPVSPWPSGPGAGR